MSSTNGQPPLTRRQVRDLERAREAGEAITGSISVVSGSPVPSSVPVTAADKAEPVSSPENSSSPVDASATPAPAPASIAEPGHTPTRRELRAQREAEAPAFPTPVPLRAPKPTTAQSGPRGLSEALSHVADVENGTAAQFVPPREAPRVAPFVDEDSDDLLDGQDSAGMPAPRSVAAVAAEPAPIADAARPVEDTTAMEDTIESAAPRRRASFQADAATQSTSAAAAAPAPSSIPSVFPFTLSASEPAPGSEHDSRPADAGAVPASEAPSAAASAASTPATVAPAATSPATTAPATPAPAAALAAASAPAAATPPPAANRIPASMPEPTTTTGFVPPVGHWSTQAERDDDHLTSTGSHFGTLTGQQNALILGDDRLTDVTGALNATGEVIITGSIDLPRSLAATGSHHIQRIDGADIDRMLEEGDRETGDSDATPVRASRAVSANTSTRQVVLAGGRPKTNRLPIVAGFLGGVVVLVIVGLVVAGFVTGVL